MRRTYEHAGNAVKSLGRETRTMFEQMIFVMDAKPTPKAMKRIAECVESNKCLCGCGRPMWKRGLARVCYYAWWKNRLAIPTEKARTAYDAGLIRRGLLLMQQGIRKFKDKSVFAKAAKDSA